MTKEDKLRQAAEEYAENRHPNANAVESPYCTTGDRYEEVKEAFFDGIISPAAKEYWNGWARVEDGLPENGIGVLLHISNGMITVGYLKTKPKHLQKKNQWRDWQLFGDLDVSLCVGENDFATHWQPLPQPPQTDKTESK